jgi:hypothetical protein
MIGINDLANDITVTPLPKPHTGLNTVTIPDDYMMGDGLTTLAGWIGGFNQHRLDPSPHAGPNTVSSYDPTRSIGHALTGFNGQSVSQLSDSGECVTPSFEKACPVHQILRMM